MNYAKQYHSPWYTSSRWTFKLKLRVPVEVRVCRGLPGTLDRRSRHILTGSWRSGRCLCSRAQWSHSMILLDHDIRRTHTRAHAVKKYTNACTHTRTHARTHARTHTQQQKREGYQTQSPHPVEGICQNTIAYNSIGLSSGCPAGDLLWHLNILFLLFVSFFLSSSL